MMQQQTIPDLNHATRDFAPSQVTSQHFANRKVVSASQLPSLDPVGQAPVYRAPREPDRSLARLGDQFVQRTARFPKTGHIIVNQDGVFIPQNVLGHDVSVRYESESLPGGKVRVVVCSRPRNLTTQAPSRVDEIDCSGELRWLDEHRQEYIGQWVALQGDRLLAHGMSAGDVYDEARRLGVEVPSLLRIEPWDELPFGGW